jgi:predicted ArsR family transcriptional regulator
VNRSKVNQVAKVCAADLDIIINLLVGEGLIVAETVKPPFGRPATIYRLALP